MVGYTPVYAYDMQPSGFGVSTVNTNPPVTQMMYQGAISKFGTPAGACPANPCAADEKCGSSGYCIPVIPHCTGKNISDCPAYTLSPVIPSDMISEKDTTAPPVNGDSPGQSVWVDYYTSQGRMGNETALVNDSVTGYQSDFSSGWTAPSSAAGEARIWAVVHTNRGGTAWVFQDVFID